MAWRLEAAATLRQPRIRDDFPEPEGPVRTVSRPRGIWTSMFLRLLSWQSLRRSQPVDAFLEGSLRRLPREGCVSGFLMALRVGDFGLFDLDVGLPE